MKKYLKLSLLAIFAMFFVIKSYSQVVIVNLSQPPPNQWHVEDMWNLTLTNTTSESLKVYLYGTVESQTDGLIFEGTSAGFELTPNYFGRVDPYQLEPVDVGYANSEYEDIVMRTGTMPEGIYTICVIVKDADTDRELGRGCIIQPITNISPPELLIPADEAELAEPLPIFSWLPPMPLSGNYFVSYKIKIVELLDGQVPIEAIEANPAWYVEKDIPSTSFQFPISARPFEPGISYAWQVTAFNDNTNYEIGQSDVWEYILTDEPVDLMLTIELIAPMVPDSLTTDRPEFIWHMDQVLKGVSYSVTVYEIDETSELDLSEILKNAKPFWTKSGIKVPMLTYPKGNPAIDTNKAYIWQVTAEKNGSIIAKSSPGAFCHAHAAMLWSCTCSLSATTTNYSVCQYGSFNIPIPQFHHSWYCWLIGEINNRQYSWDCNTYSPHLGFPQFTMNANSPSTTVNTSMPGVYHITFCAKIAGNDCSLTYTVTVFPILIPEIHDDPPGVSVSTNQYGPVITDICRTGADATLFVPNLPTGVNIDWTWSDSPLTWTPQYLQFGSLGTANPMNTNAILTNCPAGQSYVTRTFHPTFSGTSPFPVNCLQDVALKVWCPSQAGTLTVAPSTSFCIPPYSYPINLTLTLTGNVGNIITWTRSPGPGVITPSSGATIVTDVITLADGPNTYTYTATVQNGSSINACPPDQISVQVVVEEQLDPQITSLNPPGTSPIWVCPNDAVKLDLNYSSSQTSPQWEYQVDCNSSNPWISAGTADEQNTNSIGDQGPYNPIPTTSLCWRATVQSTSGICAPATSAPFEIYLYEAPCPTTISPAIPPLKCPGASVVLNAITPTCGTFPFSYQWYRDGMILSGETNQQITAITPGFYTVEVWDAGHCNSTMTPSLKVTDCAMTPWIDGPCASNGTSVITLTALPGSHPVPPPQYSPICNGPYSYIWTENGIIIATTQSITVTPSATTTYCVSIVDGLNCTAQACKTIKICQ